MRYTDPSGHRECEADSDGNCMGVKKLNLWNFAADTFNKLHGKDDLEAMARIVDKAAHLYRTFDKMIPELSEIFLGVHQSNPFTLLTAALAPGCAALGRDQKSCDKNLDGQAFGDAGFNEDFQDGYNQVFHYWAYLATTASTDMPAGGYAGGWYIGQIGNVEHEVFTLGDDIRGATWQDFALAEEGMNTGVLISFGMIKPDELGDYIRDHVGPNGDPAPYVSPFSKFAPLLGNLERNLELP